MAVTTLLLQIDAILLQRRRQVALNAKAHQRGRQSQQPSQRHVDLDAHQRAVRTLRLEILRDHKARIGA